MKQSSTPTQPTTTSVSNDVINPVIYKQAQSGPAMKKTSQDNSALLPPIAPVVVAQVVPPPNPTNYNEPDSPTTTVINKTVLDQVGFVPNPPDGYGINYADKVYQYIGAGLPPNGLWQIPF